MELSYVLLRSAEEVIPAFLFTALIAFIVALIANRRRRKVKFIDVNGYVATLNEKERAAIQRHNEKVEYNESASSWIVDILCGIICPPMFIYAIYRRVKYNKKIEENNF